MVRGCDAPVWIAGADEDERPGTLLQEVGKVLGRGQGRAFVDVARADDLSGDPASPLRGGRVVHGGRIPRPQLEIELAAGAVRGALEHRGDAFAQQLANVRVERPERALQARLLRDDVAGASRVQRGRTAHTCGS